MTAPRPIVKKFTFQPGNGDNTPSTLYPRSDGRWGSFQNTYAVWPTTDNQVASFTIKRTFTASYTGTYYFRSTVDNSGSIYVDDVLVSGANNFNQTPTRVAKTLTAGAHVLKFVVSNGGDVAGIAVTISNSSDTLIWDTRTYASVTPDPDVGRYTLTMPFNGSVTMHLWGGGGGGGSNDYYVGGNGSPGLYNTHTVDFSKNAVIEVVIGSGGQPGISGRPQIGGTGGKSRINIDSQSSKSFNGGTGGNGPVSGAGGGGGGASAVLVNGQVVAVAGGGGGGGGAGSKTNVDGKHASIENNAMATTGAIKVQTSNFNVTRDTSQGWVSVNDSYVIYGLTRGHTLAVFNPSTLALESKTTYDTYAAGNSNALTSALTSVSNGKIVVIVQWDASALSSGTRTLLNSQFGGTSTQTWSSARNSHIFIGIKNGSTPAVEKTSLTATISASFNVGITVPTEWRGENGQSRGDDGGTGGAGGGGYPGGEGGRCNSGDSGAEAGQTGGNLPSSIAQTGTNLQYYVSGVASGGTNNNKGNPGYAVLVFTAEADSVAVSAVKVAGTWRQVTAAYVKVSGAWRTITNSYIKQNGFWYPIRSTGDKTLTEFTEQTTNYGSVARTHS